MRIVGAAGAGAAAGAPLTEWLFLTATLAVMLGLPVLAVRSLWRSRHEMRGMWREGRALRRARLRAAAREAAVVRRRGSMSRAQWRAHLAACGGCRLCEPWRRPGRGL